MCFTVYGALVCILETRDGRKLTGETIGVYVIEDVVNVKSGSL